MKIGFVGLGKLGLPVAVCLGQKHEVIGWDCSPQIRDLLESEAMYPHRELGPTGKDDFQKYFKQANLHVGTTLRDLVRSCHIIFVAVQTPHGPEYEGVTRLPESRADFDYTYLRLACAEIAEWSKPEQIVVVISTVLPGTMRREIMPILKSKAKIVYNPFFIAMGTTMKDYLHPEFVLLGGDDEEAVKEVRNFYSDFLTPKYPQYGHFKPFNRFRCMSIESAELTKVAYNLLIGQKIVAANTIMEICHKTPGCNIDDVTDTLKLATDRIVSPAYMDGGMGDGGGCHPRDAIAMSWLAKQLDLSYDLFGTMMMCREEQARWLVKLVLDKWTEEMPIIVLGRAYKPGTNLCTGSPALLCLSIFEDLGYAFKSYDPHIDKDCIGVFDKPSVYLIATKHKEFKEVVFPKGSVVVDPFRFLSPGEGVKYIPVGIGEKIV